MRELPAISPGPLPIATEAIRKSLASVAKDAQVIASSPSVASADTLQALVDAREQVLYTKAGARIISTTDRMVKSLLNTRA
jgi:uridine phosphorylase